MVCITMWSDDTQTVTTRWLFIGMTATAAAAVQQSMM